MEKWRTTARKTIRQYPDLLIKERELSAVQAKDLYAVRMALDTLHRRYRNADLMQTLVDICYWQKSFTVDGAAAALHISLETAHGWDRLFVSLVDAYRHS